MTRLIWLVVFIVVLYSSIRLNPFSVRLDWLRIAMFGRLDKPYGNNGAVFIRQYTPRERIMNGLALVLVALADWLCVAMIIGHLYSLIIGNK